MITNTVFDGIDHRDYPKYADAFIVSCDIDGIPATAEQIDAISAEEVYELLINHLT